MVLGPAHRLNALSSCHATLVHIMRNVRRADKAHRRNRRVIQNGIDHFLITMDNLQNPLRRAGFQHQFGQTHRNRRIPLRRLHDKGIAHRNGRAEHPHGDHRWEVKRGNTRPQPQWLAHRININAGTRALRILAFEQMRQATGKLHDF